MLQVNQLVGFGVGGESLPLTITHRLTTTSTTNNGVSIGTSGTGRLVVVAYGRQSTATTGPTCNAVAMTEAILHQNSANTQLNVAIYYLQVDSGTTADIVTPGSSNDQADIYTVSGAPVITLQDTCVDEFTSSSGSGAVSDTIAIAKGGVAVFSYLSGASTDAVSWTNATEASDATVGSSVRISSAYRPTEATEQTGLSVGAESGARSLFVGASFRS